MAEESTPIGLVLRFELGTTFFASGGGMSFFFAGRPMRRATSIESPPGGLGLVVVMPGCLGAHTA